MIPRPFGGHHLVVYLDSDSHDFEVLVLEWILDLHNSKVNAECVGTTRFNLGLQIVFDVAGLVCGVLAWPNEFSVTTIIFGSSSAVLD